MPSVISSSVPRAGFDLAAHLHVPDRFDDRIAHPTVVATPGSSVKEQIAANYARRLAARGYLVLAFDPAFQDEENEVVGVDRCAALLGPAAPMVRRLGHGPIPAEPLPSG